MYLCFTCYVITIGALERFCMQGGPTNQNKCCGKSRGGGPINMILKLGTYPPSPLLQRPVIDTC